VRIDDRWHIGSVGKAMTSTLIALLIDRGVLRWDTTIGEALPDVKMNPGYQQVTLEQLLQHRGGIPQDMGYRAEYIERITKDARTPTECRAAYIIDVLQRAPIGRPGERMAYSNAGYAIAGYIAERVTGKPYEQLMREMVFLPLGMTMAKVGGAGDPGQPQGHVPSPNGLQVRNFTGKLPEMTAPAGDITCSIGDLARFAAFHLAGMQGKGRLLKPETFRRLHTPPPVLPGQERYACGWEIVTELTPEPFQGHGGSNGTFRAQIALFPKRGLAVVAATNAGGESDPGPPLQAILAVEKRARSKLIAK
jgi:CubicO group peptidase (beta-lactamase class C family)